MQRVFSMLAAPDRSGDVVNASLVCASAELCLASDGCGTLYLLRRSEAHVCVVTLGAATWWLI